MSVVKGGYNLINLQNNDLSTESFTIPGIYNSIETATKRTVLTNIVKDNIELRDREVLFFVDEGNFITTITLTQSSVATLTVTPYDIVNVVVG